MQFIVNATGRRNFEMTDDGGNVIATFCYPSMFARKAEITLNGGTLVTLAVTNFWSTKMQATRGAEVLYDLKMDWRQRVTITGSGREYLLKRTNVWRNEYTLYTADGIVAAEVEPIFVFKKFNYRYILATNDSDRQASDPVLLFIVVHCILFIRSMAAAAAS